MKTISTLTFLLTFSFMSAQNNSSLPYHQIPEAPSSYLPGNILARMVDGLGYRFYWASDSLTEKDLDYRPSETGKTCLETIQHIYDLSVSIKNVALNLPNIRPYEKNDLNYAEMRSKALQNLMDARAAFLNKTEAEIAELKVIFQRGEEKSEYPLWNFLNGQLSDAMYHTGQIVVFRRASGNPISSKVRVFTGINAE